MAVVAAFLVLGIVVAIAAVVVVREAVRMTTAPPPVLFSMDEAYDFVVDHLPDDVAATLTPDDVRRILAFQAEYFARTGVAPNGASANGAASTVPSIVVLGGPDTIAYILERAEATGEAYLPEQVVPVLETQLRYLREIGAVSTPVDGPEDPDGAP